MENSVKNCRSYNSFNGGSQDYNGSDSDKDTDKSLFYKIEILKILHPLIQDIIILKKLVKKLQVKKYL